MSDLPLIFESFPAGHLQCNCTVLGNPQTKKGIVIDPGGDPEKISAIIRQHGLNITQIIHTHAHFDHIMASGIIKKSTGAQIGLHRGDEFLWRSLESQCQMFGLPYHPIPEPDYFYRDEAEISDLNGIILHTPGHTPGSVCFWFQAQKLLIAGDTLFHRSIGRTDLWGGDSHLIIKSIQERLYTLDDDARVITGHGPETILGQEKISNPFVRAY